jgi:hypothetical protein
VIQMECLQRVVRADAVAGGLGREFRTFGGFVSGVAASLVGFDDE